jgi:hypothetical protein
MKIIHVVEFFKVLNKTKDVSKISLLVICCVYTLSGQTVAPCNWVCSCGGMICIAVGSHVSHRHIQSVILGTYAPKVLKANDKFAFQPCAHKNYLSLEALHWMCLVTIICGRWHKALVLGVRC